MNGKAFKNPSRISSANIIASRVFCDDDGGEQDALLITDLSQ
jgi:hypothetical protein